MNAALGSLQDAQNQLQVAAANKGGHRVKAMGIINQAISDVQAGEQWAAANPGYAPPGDDAPDPSLDAPIPGGVQEPHMAAALEDLRQARAELRAASPDKGGYRVRAIGEVNAAINQIKMGIAVGLGR
jgi:hypothetical protein